MKAKLDTVCKRIEVMNVRRKNLEQFMADLMKQPAMVTEFDPFPWHKIVEEVMVSGQGDMQFRFSHGIETLSMILKHNECIKNQ